jgi:acyl dehydratase
MVNRNVGDFSATYSAKDVILYALSIGFGSKAQGYGYEQDLRFLYEEHLDFTVVPTFCLALLFWAQENGFVGDSSKIPAFPPPMMQSMGVLPRRFLREVGPVDEYPVLHTFQSITWVRQMPVPRHKKALTILRGKFLAVVPKSVGAFVTTETEIYENSSDVRSNLLCTVRSTALVLGLPSEQVIPFMDPSVVSELREPIFLGDKLFLFELDCEIAPNTALLYRLASGDSNRIHVDPFAVPLVGGDDKDSSTGPRPLLHGLCTLGIATRMILQFMTLQHDNLSVRHLEGKFVKPVFVNDVITVQAWKLTDANEGNVRILFVAQNKKTGEALLDSGRMLLVPNKETKTRLSRL